jgi:hypothetical protein
MNPKEALAPILSSTKKPIKDWVAVGKDAFMCLMPDTFPYEFGKISAKLLRVMQSPKI